MSRHAPSPELAFETLAGRLLARRIERVEPPLRLVLAAIVALLTATLFWQIRVPLDGVVRAAGPLAGARVVAALLLLIAAAAALATGARHARLLSDPPGPEWLALPIPPHLIARHLLFEARLVGSLAFPAALSVLVAAVGLLPATWLLLLVAAFIVAWLEATRIAAAVTRRRQAARAPHPLNVAPIVRVLAAGARRKPARAVRPPRWRRAAAWRAVAALDRLVAWRDAGVRQRVLGAGLFMLLGAAAWFTPAPPEVRRALAFGGAMLAFAGVGRIAIALVAADPPDALRPLPLSLASVWRGRGAPIVVTAIALSTLYALLAATLPWPARLGIALLWPVPLVLVAVLGLHHALSLQPRAAAAENLYATWLGIAVVSSLMIPLLGWVVLGGASIQAARRLPRWWRPEVS